MATNKALSTNSTLRYVGVLMLVGLFMWPYNATAASALDTTNSLDSIVYSSGSSNEYPIGPPATYPYAGFRYIPAAQHSICQVSTLTRRDNTQPIGSSTIALSVYRNPTSNASTSPFYAGALIKNADSSYQVTATTTSYEQLDFTFTPCITLQGGYPYNFIFTTTNTGTFYMEGNSSNLTPTTLRTGIGTILSDRDFYSGGSFIQSNLGNKDGSNPFNSGMLFMSTVINGTESFSNFTASSTTSYSSPNCTPPTSILDVGGGVSYALCYMFVPNQTLIDQYANLSDLITTKFPFTYISGLSDIQTAMEGQSASTTPNATFVFPLGATYTNPSNGATTTTFTMFSPATIVADVPVLGTLRTYMAYIIYFTFGIFAFRRVIKLI